MIIDFSNPWAFVVWYFITAGLLFAAYKVKKAWICLIPTIYFLIILTIHAANPDMMINNTIHRVFNFLGLGTAISFFLVVDEVETRRKVISQVFKNRYKKDKLPSDLEELSEDESEDSKSE